MQQFNIEELKPHPRNTEFFDDLSGGKWDELLQSIKVRIEAGKRGNIEPIIITQDKMIVSGHQRVRAFKELGIPTIEAEVKIYGNDDEILQDLIETNIRQRGEVGGSAKKVGARIKELERLYGIHHGGHGSNQYVQNTNNSVSAKSQEYIAEQMGFSIQTLQNYKKLTEMIPELEDLVDTGIVTKTTALAIMKELEPDEQKELIENMDVTKKITKAQVDQYIKEINNLKENPPLPNDYEENKSELVKTQAELKKTKENLAATNIKLRQMETKLNLTKEENDRYQQLKKDIQSLTLKRQNLNKRIANIEEITKLSNELQHTLEKDLAPMKFKRCIDELDFSNDSIVLQNVKEIVNRVDDWLREMKIVIDYTPEIIIEQ